MSEIVVQEFMTLDGVIQGPGGDGEDEEGDFPYSGWQMDYDADHFASGDGAGGANGAEGTAGDEGDGLIAEWESRTGALLLGRKTYDIWARAWGVWSEDEPGLMGEFTRRYNRVTKFVASSTLIDPSWKNTVVVRDVASEVAELKQRTDIDGEIRVWGSADLIRSLGEHDLVDEYRLIVYPVVLGTGKKLFPEGFALSRFTVAETRPLTSGAVVNVYRRERD
ncbi:dihydrofolate reductase family protein [Schumannella soli]|uniref:Bacterial bifunctional deaminase-reductase C-terminal domain-containing protein n=1 Tax=Schumannella soli TaxID=2590779 RepID=A0A506XNR8_9MICO|nr:dihydrofolate reductase family protein [Schumannella soli]TPW74261.1 hypothetical protein FJ657_16735 [Schumannella soli]